MAKYQLRAKSNLGLGPIMLLLYIDDIGQNIASKIQLFVDDCILCRVIKSPCDEQGLQHTSQIKFNINKCVVL